ncbi:DUF2306 domain-containing protein [Phenylobacterium sp.]|uniref:DUF2306 domain-containing protein n=1 Tax=Phenylobacterium sp. TaxID=1871053 RepID=UPI003BA8C532
MTLQASLSPRGALADRALAASAQFWFVTAVIGQWAFLYYIVAFYGPSTLSGDFPAWARNTLLLKGYVAGDTAGNLTFAAHALLAGIIAFGGALQVLPQLRNRWPAVHRWNGRLFLVVACGLAVSGLYLVWVRHTNPALLGSLATSLNAALILAFAGLALAAARGRDFAAHRRWALRLYLVSNAQWFMRVGFFAYVLAQGGHPVGTELFGEIWSFGCILVPLAVLELFLRAQRGGAPRARLAMAAGLFSVTLVMAAGAIGFTLFSLSLLA